MTNQVGEVSVKAVVDMAGFGDELNRAVQREAEKAAEAMAAAFDGAAEEIDAALAGAAPDLDAEFAAAGDSAADRLADGFDGTSAEIDAAVGAPDLTGEFGAAGDRAGDALADGFDGVPDDLAATADEAADAVAAEMDDLAGVGEEAGADIAEGVGAGFEGNIEEVKRDLAAGLAVVSAAITAALVAGIVEAAQLDAGLREVVTLFGETGDAAAESLGRLAPQVRELSDEVGFAQEELVGGLYNAISAGVPEDNVFDFLGTASRFAIAGVTDVGTAITGLSSAANAFAIDFSEAEDVADTFFAGVQAGQTTVPELSAALFNVAPAASAAGLALDETVAAVAALTASGVPTSVATTQIRASIVELSDAGSAVGEVFTEVAGVSFRDFIASGGDLAGALAILQGEAEATGAQVGDYFGSVEAAAAAQTLAKDTAGSYAAALDFQAERAGAASAAFDLVNESASRQFETVKTQLTNIIATFGDAFLPTVISLLETVLELAEVFAALPEPMQQAAAVGLALTAAVTGLAAAALLVGPRLVAMNAALAATGPVGARAAAGISATRAALFGPWGIAAAAATAALTGLHSAFRTSRDEAGALADEIVATSETTEEASRRLTGALQEQVESLGTSEGAWERIKGIFPIPGYGIAKTAIEDITSAVTLWDRANDDVLVSIGRVVDSDIARELREAARGADDAGESAEGAAGGVDELGEEMEEAASTGQQLLDVLAGLDGGMIDLDRATITYIESIEDMIDAFARNGATVDTNTEAGRENVGVIMEAVRGTRDHIAALVDAGAPMNELTRVTHEHVNQLRAEMEQAGFTAAQIDHLIERYGLVPTDIITEVSAFGIENTTERVNRLRQSLLDLSAQINVNIPTFQLDVPRGVKGYAAGGPFAAGDTSIVGEEGPELVIFDRPGVVIPANITEMLRSRTVTPTQAAAAGGGSVTVTQNIYTTDPVKAGRESARELRTAVHLGGPIR